MSKPTVFNMALRKEAARQRLLQTVKRVLEEEPEFFAAAMEIIEPDNPAGDVATLHFPNGIALRICLLKQVTGTDVIRRGILAMERVAQPDATWQHTLLVMPGLEIDRPMYMTRNVTICSLEFSLIHTTLTTLRATHA